MTVQYEVDGNIFREITTNWICAYANEFLIKAHRFDTDQTGNTVEHLQLSDGRVFTRLVRGPRAVHISKVYNPHRRNAQPSMREHSAAHS